MFDENQNPIRGPNNPDPWGRIAHAFVRAPRHTFVALLLVAALFAFEVFNFDTTKYALSDLLGESGALGLSWAAVLGFAFCAIDFAGLVRIFTPEQGQAEHKEVWYLMGAWLLGATMNAVMTWYAVSLTLLNRPLQASQVLSQEQMLTAVPIFVAILVWLTRILFIGSLSMAGEHIFAVAREYDRQERKQLAQPVMTQTQSLPKPARRPTGAPRREPQTVTRRNRPEPVYVNDVDDVEQLVSPPPKPQREGGVEPRNSRVRQRPPLSGNRGVSPMRAKDRR